MGRQYRTDEGRLFIHKISPSSAIIHSGTNEIMNIDLSDNSFSGISVSIVDNSIDGVFSL